MSLIEVILYSLGFIALLVLTQDVHIFPGAFLSKITLAPHRKKKIPPEIESFFISSSRGVQLEVWRYAAGERTACSKYVGIIFHGNGAAVENFIFYQMWFAELGITTYNFDYRGFGRSSGWPSERGIYDDSDAVWQYVLKREQIDPSHVIVIGISVGSAPAARIAAKNHAKILILSSAFTDLKSAVRVQTLVGLLSPFVRHKLSTIGYVRELKGTDLLLCCGLKDRIIPPSHSTELKSAYVGTGKVRYHSSTVAGHNLAFFALKEELRESVKELLQ